MECGCYQGDHHGDRDVGDFNLEEDQSPQHHPLHRSWDHKTMDSVIESEVGLKADSPNIAEAETSNSKPHEEEKEVKTESILKEEKKKKKKEEDEDEKTKTAFHKLFAFADSFDIILMILGTIGAVGNGLGFPIMTILFGDVIDVFGQNQNSSDVSDKIAKVALKFVYLGLGTLVAALLRKNKSRRLG
ncbi:hypothetical protein Bca4012_064296 [Brassica carinata]|uniref:Uncharacterized protein n=1 Tax=Brassica carinata TaxID=52824 RepID=A0A8X7SFH7_BRACI|nr:hypothetical protein Bca52824_033874 [Brassica carinata]